jgi:CBS domain containing-hemolysin-like protein
MVSGRAPLESVAEVLGAPLDHAGVSTIGGLVYTAFGRVPVAGEQIELGGFRVTVEQVVRRRIRRLRFERLNP